MVKPTPSPTVKPTPLSTVKPTPHPRHKSTVGTSTTSGPKPANHSSQREVSALPNLTLPHDAPDWMRLALKTMQLVDFGHGWSRLVLIWYKFEEKHAFDSKGPRLDATHRPRAVAGWIQHARKNYKPDSSVMSKFEVDFW